MTGIRELDEVSFSVKSPVTRLRSSLVVHGDGCVRLALVDGDVCIEAPDGFAIICEVGYDSGSSMNVGLIVAV